MIFAHELSKVNFIKWKMYIYGVAQTGYLKKRSFMCIYINVVFIMQYYWVCYNIQCLSILYHYIIFHTFSAFWLRSSVVSVLLSLISETVSNAYNWWLGIFMKPYYHLKYYNLSIVHVVSLRVAGYIFFYF